MGIKCGNTINYSITNISLSELLCLTKFRMGRRVQCSTDDTNKPMVDLDASWIVRRCNLQASMRVNYLIGICLCFLLEGCCVTIICDGEVRHHTKRATTKRVADFHHQSLEFHNIKCKLSCCTKRLQEDHIPSIERDALKEKQDVYRKRIVSLEKKFAQAKIKVGDELFEKITIEINKLTTIYPELDIKKRLTVVQAEFQADSVIAYRSVRCMNDLVICNDSDQAVHVGRDCCCVNDFKYIEKQKKRTLENISIYCTNKETLLSLANSIPISLNSPQIKCPKYPILENIHYPSVRGLIAVGIGCDVFLSGIPMITPRSLHEYFNSKKNHISNQYEDLLDFMVEKKIKSNAKRNNNELVDAAKIRKLIEIYVESYLFEPANYFVDIEKEEQQRTNMYIHGITPKKLHPYNEAFRRNNTSIEIDSEVVDCSIFKCVGPGTGEHQFLSDEGYKHCIQCNAIMCSTCQFKTFEEGGNDENVRLCVRCVIEKVTINNNIPAQEELTEQKTRAEMMEELSAVGTPIRTTEDIEDVIDLHDALIGNKLAIYNNGILMESISIPSEPSTYLQVTEKISTFDVRNGGRYIADNNLSTNNKIELTCLLADLVNIQNNQTGTGYTYHHLLPEIILMFANKARRHSGFRLCKRAVRHAMDPQSIDIYEAKGHVIKYNENIGLEIKHKVKASMKQDIYDVTLAFTRGTIVSCRCSCIAGSNNNERIICVHILPVLFQITQFLFQYMAESILMELANFWNDNEIINDNNLELTLLHQLQSSIETLIIADDIKKYTNKTNDIRELLEPYNVGTERRKLALPRPEYTSKLGPLKDVDFSSIINKTIRMRKKQTINNVSDDEEQVNENINNNVSDDEEQQLNENDNNNNHSTPPLEISTYKRICESIQVLTKTLGLPQRSTLILNELIGYKLLQYRSGSLYFGENNDVFHPRHDNEKHKQWKDAIKLANVQVRSYKKTYNRNITNVPINNNNNENLPINNNNNENLPNRISSTRKWKKCVVCGSTTTAMGDAVSFFQIPYIYMEPVTSKTKDARRKTYAIHRHRRQIYLDRFEINDKREMQYIYHCSNHEMVREQFRIKWKNKNKEIVNAITHLVVPAPSNKCPNTRMQSSIRTTIFPTLKKATTKRNIPSSDDEDEESLVAQPRKKSKSYMQCCFVNCCNRRNDPTLSWKKIPPLQKNPSPNKKLWNHQLEQRAIKSFLRAESLRRIGLSASDSRNDIRICNKHEIEKVKVSVTWNNIKNEQITTKIDMNLPSSAGVQQTTTNFTSRGTALDRNIRRQVSTVVAQANSGDGEAAYRLMMLRMMNDGDNDTIIDNCIMTQNSQSSQTTNKERISIRRNNNVITTTTKTPAVQIDGLTDRSVQLSTGFPTLLALLSFVTIINEGDVIEIVKTTTNILTWFEEYYSFFEIIYGKGVNRWVDAVKQYKVNDVTIRKSFIGVLVKVLLTRETWPRFATYHEDEFFRNLEKWMAYEGSRVIMFDNTNIHLKKSSDAEIQRTTYSLYYADNVGKGAVFVQPCGWMGTHDLWVGNVSDSEYMQGSGIFPILNKFIDVHDRGTSDCRYTIILDKGYRITSDAWRNGQHMVLQPKFAKSGERFTTCDTLLTSSVATDRAGNERAVRYAKISDFLSKGLLEHESVETLCDVWLAWGFMTNFMYRSVH